MKGLKGEGVKQNQSKGPSGAAEQGPLFPRLHVNETEKAGPKAPPRNKMALYEQFTVPSHRFVQPNQKPATTMYQQQYGVRELGYPYAPYYMPSGRTHGVPMYAQPSHNTSSSGVICSGGVNEEVPQNAPPRHYKAGKSSPCRVTRHAKEATMKCSLEVNNKITTVPAQCSLTNQAEESTNSFQNAPSDMEGPQIAEITEILQEALSTVKVGAECMGPDVKRWELSRGQFSVDSATLTCLTDQGNLKQASQLREGPLGPSDTSNIKSNLQKQSSKDECKADCVTQALTSNVHCTSQSGTFLEPNSLEERTTVNADCQSSLSSENQANAGLQYALTSGEISQDIVHKNAFKNSINDVRKVDNCVGRFSKPSNACSEEIKHIQIRNSEVSQTSQYGTHKEGHFDGLIVPSTNLDPMWVIKPKDVIRAVGQQQFWKARKKLLRQQRIFSDQVFQLHKLIKVQKLLAETPGTMIDEEMHLEMREEYVASTPLVKGSTDSSENANKVISSFKEGSKCKSSEAEQLKNKWEQTQADGKADLASSECGPELSSAGVSVWGYPSLGPWVCGPMAAHGGPFNYPPYAGVLPPGSAFDLPFRPSLPGSVATMMSFGIPYHHRRQESPAEMDPNYRPATAFKQQGSGTMSVHSDHASNDLATSWYFAQYNHLNNNRLLAGGSNKDAPTGSGASVNKSSATAQAVKTSCFPGLAYQWGLNCQAGPLNMDGFDSSAHRSEQSSPSNASRLNCRTPSTPSTPPARSFGLIHQDVEGPPNLDPALSAHRFSSFNRFDRGKKLVEREKLVTRTESYAKHQKDAVCSSSSGCPSSYGNEDPPDVNASALELFPLVPSMGSSGWIGGRVVTPGEEGQGGIIRAVPHRAIAASKSAAGILLSLQRERQK